MSVAFRGKHVVAGLTLVLTFAARAASGGVLVNDTWLDGTDDDPAAPVYSENGTDADLDGNLESVWYQGGAGSLNPTGPGGPLRGDMTTGGTSSASWTTYFTPEASPVTLQQGETLRVTWVFTPINIGGANTSQNFRLAVVDSPSASRISANGTPGSSTYTGYGMFMNMAETLGNSNPFQLREHDGNGALLSGTADWLVLANGATSGADGYDSGVSYTYMMELTRNALNELEILSTMSGGTLDNDGLASVAFTDTTPLSFTFDTFAVRPSGATTTAEFFDTTLFHVEHIVPEPSAAALLAIAAVGALRRRARRD